jgi:anti-sigma regulatory factor (Ser/Thr protein kinase)
VLGYLDPALGTFTYAVAGHPLPLVGFPDGRVQMLHAAGLPLGVGKTSMTGEQSVSLPLDALLVLYSDGLIEIDRDVESGEAVLREAVAAEVRRRPANPAEDILRQVFRGRPPADDVVALTATIVEPPRTQFGLSLAATPDTSRVVRYTLQRFLQAAGVDRERSEGFLVAVGEAVNNAVEHAYPMLDGIVDVRGRRDADRVTVEVADRGRWRSEAEAGRPAHRGHGLALMRVLSDDVEVERSGAGTRVLLTLRTR